MQAGFGYNRRVSHTKCNSAHVFMSVHEVLCKDISAAVSVKCSKCKLQERNSSQGQEGKPQSFSVSASLSKGKRGANRIIPKADWCQSQLSLNRKV